MARAAGAPTANDIAVRRLNPIGRWRTYWRRVAELVSARWRPILVYSAAILVFNTLRVQSVVPVDDPLFPIAVITPYMLGAPVLIFTALVLSEALGLQGVRHALASFAGLVLVNIVFLSIVLWFYGAMNRPLVESKLIVSDAAYIGRMLWFDLAGGMLLVAYFAIREREAASVRAAQAAQTERAQTERATMAARLKVMQARVEPELLFGVLGEVRDLYKRAPSDADALLDDLIAYLRAALPQMRSEASTLGREATLAAAYLKLVPAGRDGRLLAETSIAPELNDLPFPPMVLLPLVQAAAESSIVRVTITVDGPPKAAPSGVAVRVDPPQRPVGWNDERLAPLRTTLAQYFGPQSRLHVDASGAVARWGGIDPGGPGFAGATSSRERVARLT
jgi:hypothetical protein